MNQSYSISGMHCGSCVARVTAALKPFADDVTVTLNPPRAVLRDARGTDLAKLNAEIAKAGTYALTPLAGPGAADAAAAPARQPTAKAIQSTGPDGLSWLVTYQPLLLIIGYVAIASFAGSQMADGFSWPHYMMNFMAGFFLVFSGFKFLNVSGFADAYATYDLLAKRWPTWGFIYPFLELGLGLAYLFRFEPFLTNLATIVLMGFSSLGVIGALRSNRKITCACLGTVFNLPMSTVTLVEDLSMVAMAAMALMLGHN